MESARLGSAAVYHPGLTASRIVLGCMSFADTARGVNEWSLSEGAAGPFLAQAAELEAHYVPQGPAGF